MLFDTPVDGTVDPADLLTTSSLFVPGLGDYDLATLSIIFGAGPILQMASPTEIVFTDLIVVTEQAIAGQPEVSCLDTFFCDMVFEPPLDPNGFIDPFIFLGIEFDLFFSPVATDVIPIPAAVWLFGSALGLLGWLKRRST